MSAGSPLPTNKGSPDPDGARSGETTVLLVDDSPVDSRQIAGLIRTHLGWEVICAADGLEALDRIRQQVPSLVLTDLMMPRMNGLELVQVVRSQIPLVPVVLITAYGSEDLAIMALRQGAASYVSKKTLPRYLTETLTQVMAAAQADRDQERLLRNLTLLDNHFELDNDPTLVPVVVSYFQPFFAALGLGDETAQVRVSIALEEALLNGLYHGNLEVGSHLRQDDPQPYYKLADQRREQPPYRDRRLHLDARLTGEQAVFVVRDEGPGFNSADLPDPTDPRNLERSSGRGLLLIRTFMDEVHYNDSGNEISMTKRRPKPKGERTGDEHRTSNLEQRTSNV